MRHWSRLFLMHAPGRESTAASGSRAARDPHRPIEAPQADVGFELLRAAGPHRRKRRYGHPKDPCAIRQSKGRGTWGSEDLSQAVKGGGDSGDATPAAGIGAGAGDSSSEPVMTVGGEKGAGREARGSAGHD